MKHGRDIETSTELTNSSNCNFIAECGNDENSRGPWDMENGLIIENWIAIADGIGAHWSLNSFAAASEHLNGPSGCVIGPFASSEQQFYCVTYRIP